MFLLICVGFENKLDVNGNTILECGDDLDVPGLIDNPLTRFVFRMLVFILEGYSKDYFFRVKDYKEGIYG